MSLKLSTGLRNKLLATGSLSSLLAGGLIKIYSGTPPASADDAVTGTLLCTISLNNTGGGISMATTATAGVLSKDPTQVWSGSNAVGGTASYYRHVAAGDAGDSSATSARLQGTVGVAGAELNLSSVTLVASAPQTIDYYSIALPSA